MNGLKAAALAALLAGVGLLVYGGAQGDVGIALAFAIIPIVHGTGPAAVLGMLLMFAAVPLWALGSMREMRGFAGGPPPDPAGPRVATERRSGGFVLLGPIPIVWGDARMRKWMVVAGMVVLGLWLAAALWLRG